MTAQKRYTINFTSFAQVDEAMLKVVHASREFETAQFSNREWAANQKLIAAAANLRKTIRNIEKEINDAYDNGWLK